MSVLRKTADRERPCMTLVVAPRDGTLCQQNTKQTLGRSRRVRDK